MKKKQLKIGYFVNQVNQCNDLSRLISIWNILVCHKRKYSLIDIYRLKNAIKQRCFKVKGDFLLKNMFWKHLSE